jgi:pimeloyl-ACP methyl ester carboxylesterase
MPPQPHLARLRAPALFVIGSDDPYCRTDLLEQVVATIPGPAAVHVVAGGDHSFQAKAGAPRPTHVLQAEAIRVALAWLADQLRKGNL